VEQKLAIDGRLDEPAWDRVPFSSGFVTRHGHAAMAQTGVKVLHDDRHLYLAFACADPATARIKAQAADTSEFWVTRDDVLVMLLQPRGERPTYFQLGFNTEGVQFHQKVVGGDRDYAPLPGWYAKTAVASDGLWTAEVVIPKAMLGLEAGERPDFRANFHRVFRDHKIEHGSWSYSASNWHATEDFGRIVLEE
jgi:hypothetical protein